MKFINWKVRAKNPVFWFQVAAAVVVPVFSYMGLTVEEITTWAKLGQVTMDAISNPYIVLMIVVSAFNAIQDPTTKGISDSERALEYHKPSK